MANINRSDTWNLILSFFLSCQLTLSWDTPIPLLFVSLIVSVNFPCSSDFAADLVQLCALTTSWLLRSVITCLITLLSNSRTAHCSAKVAGHCWVLDAWSLTMLLMSVHLFDLKNYWQNQIRACNEAFFANACIFGKFQPHPSVLGKHSYCIIVLMLFCNPSWNST